MDGPGVPYDPEEAFGLAPGDVVVAEYGNQDERYYIQQLRRRYRVWWGSDTTCVLPCLAAYFWVGRLTPDGHPQKDGDGNLKTTKGLMPVYSHGRSRWTNALSGAVRLRRVSRVQVPVGTGLFETGPKPLIGLRGGRIFRKEPYSFDSGVDPFPRRPIGVFHCRECKTDFNARVEDRAERQGCPECGKIPPVRNVHYYPTKGILRGHSGHKMYPPFPSWEVRSREMQVREMQDREMRGRTPAPGSLTRPLAGSCGMEKASVTPEPLDRAKV